MGNTNHTYMGPGANIWPAIKYLRSRGATSEANAISIEEIPSEDFKQLLKLNGQTSMWIGVTPEGKYWYRIQMIFFYIFPVLIILGISLYIALVSSGILSFGRDIVKQSRGVIEGLDEGTGFGFDKK